MDGLDDFLEPGTITAEPQPEVTEAAEPEGPARDEHGRFAPKQTGETPPADEAAEPVPPTETKDQLPPETFKGLKEEREKRQNLERELQALKDQFQSLQNPPAPPPSVYEDEAGFSQHITGQAVTQASFNARLDMSEMLASQAHEDFDEMKGKFIEMMSLNPVLQQQALEARHPWEKAYQIAKNAAKMEALGATDVTELEAKLREQITAELAAPKPAPPVLPASLADVQSASAPAQAGPPPFEQLFGPKR